MKASSILHFFMMSLILYTTLVHEICESQRSQSSLSSPEPTIATKPEGPTVSDTRNSASIVSGTKEGLISLAVGVTRSTG